MNVKVNVMGTGGYVALHDDFSLPFCVFCCACACTRRGMEEKGGDTVTHRDTDGRHADTLCDQLLASSPTS